MADITIKDVREKYPQYSDMPDDKLAEALHQKYYADMPRDDFNKKIGLSAKAPEQPKDDMSGLEKFGVGVGYGMKQVGQGALQTVLQGGQYIRNKLGMESNQANVDKLQATIDSDKQAFKGLANESTTAKAGAIVGETIPALALPGGAAKGIVSRAITSAGQGAIIGGLQPTSEGESRGKNALVGGVAGAGTSAAMSAVGKAIPAAGKLAKETLGMTTGAGPGAIDEAITGSPMFKKALRGKMTGEEVVENAKDALSVIKDKRADSYKAKLSDVTDNKEPIDLAEIKNAVTEKLKNFVKYTEAEVPTGYSKASKGVNHEAAPYPTGGGFSVKGPDGQYIKGQGGHAIFYKDAETAKSAAEAMAQRATGYAEKETANAGKQSQKIPMFNWSRTTVGDIKTSKDAKELKQIYKKISDWGSQPGDNTAIELDRLRRDLDNHWSDSSRVRAFVTDARNVVDKAIKKNVPEYAEMTKGYAEATSLIKDIESGLMMKKQGMSGRVTADQTLRRLTSAMRENFELRKDLVDALGTQGGKDVAGQVAGYAMNSTIPRGLVAKMGGYGVGGAAALHLLSPQFLPILAASSPRVMGEFVMAFGKAQRGLATAGATKAGMATKNILPKILPKAAAVAATQDN